jgi:hypothetical protein
MSLKSTLAENQKKVNGYLFTDSGYRCIFNKTHDSSSHITGYDSPKSEDIDYIIENKLKAVVLSDKARSVSTYLPMIANDMREGAITSLSHVSFEVYANIVEKLGSTIYGVRPMNFVQEMFGDVASSIKVMGAMKSNNPSSIVGLMLDSPLKDVADWHVPSEDGLRLFSKIQNQLLSDMARRRADIDKLEAESKSMHFSDPGKSALFLLIHEHQCVLKYANYLSNVITWNSLMVKAKNFDVIAGMKEILDFSKILQNEFKSVLKANPKETHGTLHSAGSSDNLGALFSLVDKQAAAAIKIAQREFSVDTGVRM